MKTAVRTHLKSKTLCSKKSYTTSREKEIVLINFRFYQKLFVVFIFLSSFLIFPESPRELENICETYNTRRLCDVW